MLRALYSTLIAVLLVTSPMAEELKLRLGSQDYLGPAEFAVIADDKEIYRASISKPDGETFVIQVPDAVVSLGIAFTNDAAAPVAPGQTRPRGQDRNLVIYEVQFRGKSWRGPDLPQLPGTAPSGASLLVGSALTVPVPFDGTPRPIASTAVSSPSPNADSKPETPVEQPLTQFVGGNGGTPLFFVGDSLTAGAGAGGAQNTVASTVSSLLNNREFSVLARGGAGSTKILADFLEQGPHLPENVVTIIWVGRNNYSDAAAVIRDIDTIASRLPNRRYLVLSIIPGLYGFEQNGGEGLRQIDALNYRLSQKLGFRFLQVGQDLTPEDRSDNVHLNAAGYRKIAEQVADNLRIKGW